MAFDINQFRAQMVNDGARPNLFEVQMAFPSFAIGASNASPLMTFMCKSAQLPGSTIGVVPVQYFGRELKFAGNRTFADWTITIINDENFLIRNAFESWMNAINTHKTNLRSVSALRPVDYTKDAKVLQFGKAGGTAIKQYNFVGCFPSDLSPIDLDWGSNDTMEEFTVTLSYQYWEVAGAQSALTT